MDRTSVDGFELALRSPENFNFPAAGGTDESFLKSLSEALDKPAQSIPYLRAKSLKDALNVVAAVAALRNQPLYIAPSVDQLTAMVPTLAASSPVLSAGALPTAMVKGGLLAIPDLSNGDPDPNLLPILMGNRHIDLPDLGFAVNAKDEFRVLYCSAIYNGEDTLPQVLASFLQDPLDVPGLTTEQATKTLESRFPESPKALIADIAKLINQAKALGRPATVDDGEKLATKLFATPEYSASDLANAARPLFGDDIAKLVEEQKLLNSFHELENNKLLAELKEELKDEES